MTIFFWVVAILLVGLGGFTGYTNWKIYFEARKAREAFKAGHPDAQTHRQSSLRLWLYMIMLGACIGFAIMILFVPLSDPSQEESRYAQAVVYVGLAIFAIAMLGEALADHEIFYTPDGFLYEADIIRYKSIRTVTVQKGLFKNSSLALSNGKDLTVSKSTAAWIEEHFQEWKKTKRDTFKTRKERRAAARAQRENR